ncbi:DUF1834 family protein [Iodobacter sp.]|uniref:DUF1834 family protein n=1 Tax=Iodobacter sp. TaxID=1915058 RepID=UPI0025D62C6F|nr:DUF1834 family protein [Iodobacter sp.]
MSAPVSLEQIEDALVARLKQGLGRLATSVENYGGELDDLTPEVIRCFPAVWVTFGGIIRSEKTKTSEKSIKASGQWVVMCAARNIRNHNAARQGGVGEVGAYQLVRSVRRLLQQQDLGLAIDYLQPGRVRTLYNTKLGHDAVSIFACEFSTAWIEHALENGHWPVDGRAADVVFVGNHGRKDLPDPDLLRIRLEHDLTPPGDGKPEATDIINLRS